MALSHYLSQSVICTILFYNYGLGLYGETGTFAGLVLSGILFALQVVLSRWWMHRFHAGPCEWLWRALTCGEWKAKKLT